MCFGTSSSRHPAALDADEVLNSRPIQNPGTTSSKTSRMAQDTYAPPPGPPPNYRGPQQTAPDPSTNQHQLYTPPAGPPPSNQEQYAPPLGPPPQGSQHNWQTAVPDTSLLPPPPSIGYERSPTNNATEEESISAENWLQNQPQQDPVNIVNSSAFEPSETFLYAPTNFQGELKQINPGKWHVRTKRNSPDSCIVSAVPLYSVKAHSLSLINTPKTIYFEVKILPGSRSDEISLGMGFLAQPYPPFRLPGWERASLGIHGDDGHRYVNDKWGGRDFTGPFKRGQTVGIGMRFSRRVNEPPVYSDALAPMSSVSPIDVEVFFTRDGKIDGGWNIHEELDAAQDLPVTGLEGMHDLYAAVGTFNVVEFDVLFNPKDWLYRAKNHT